MSSSLFDLKTLRVFLSVAELANMTSAAKRLGLSQSAVSQAVRQLEESLGIVLVDRERRPLVLTAAGVVMRERGGKLVTDAESLFKAVREQAGSQAQLLRLGMVDSFAGTIGPLLTSDLLRTTVRLHISSGPSQSIGEWLKERRLDMIVSTDALESVEGLERHRLLVEPYVLVLPRSLAASHPEPTLAGLAAAAPLVRFSLNSHIGAEIERHLRQQGVVPAHCLEIDTSETLVAMVAGGVGWALITPLCLLQARAREKAVVMMPLREARLSREFHLISREGEYGALPAHAANVCRSIARDYALPETGRIMPWVVDQLLIEATQSTSGRD
jgi:DNA-binding transcriptional LysR family regulator